MGRARGAIRASSAGASRRAAVSAVLAPESPLGVCTDKYPSSFAAGAPFFARSMVDFGVENLPAWDSRDDADKAAALLLAEIGGAVQTVVGEVAALTVAPPGEPLHALVVQQLPDWVKPHTQQKKLVARYGEHLGIGIYVYDQAAGIWYKRVLHGRSVCAAVRYPLKTAETACKKRQALAATISAGGFKVGARVTDGYPPALTRADAQLRRVQTAAEEGRRREQELRQQQREAAIAAEQERRMRRRLAGIDPTQLLRAEGY